MHAYGAFLMLGILLRFTPVFDSFLSAFAPYSGGNHHQDNETRHPNDIEPNHAFLNILFRDLKHLREFAISDFDERGVLHEPFCGIHKQMDSKFCR
mgnify:CR=1 FL=1